MQITHLGHAAVLLEAAGLRVLFDPGNFSDEWHGLTDLDAIPVGLRGLHPRNPVNRVRGGGTQLELSPRIRGISPRSQPPGDDGLSPATSALVRGLAAAAWSWPLDTSS